MQRARVSCCLLVAVLLLFVSDVSAQSSVWEEKFMAVASPSSIYSHLAVYTTEPHVAGTPGDYNTAVYTATQYEKYGLSNVEIQEETVLLTYPISRSVSIVSPPSARFQCPLKEDTEPLDPTSGNPDVVPTFNGFSPSGNVTSEVVYVNYGGTEDYAALEELNVSVEGKIVIARYGTIFRGTIAMLAEERGAVGVLIYSDPADDGYVQGTVFPEGPWRSNSSVQRGSVQFLSKCPGNPARLNCASPEEQPTYSYTQSIPSVPVQPLSYGDALPILSSLNGSVAPDSFQGGLPITYHVGGEDTQVNLFLDIQFVNTTIWNVVGSIPANTSSPTANEIVLMGNHRDAWVFGAVDPNSGSAVLLEVIRSFGTLLKEGWQPQRELRFASWDGEEYGLLGSTAYADANAEELTQNAIAYLNLDTAVSGQDFTAIAMPQFYSAIREVTKKVTDPATGTSVYERWSKELAILGSGSDYTAFIDHYGIPALNIEFDGPYGVYHSEYDSMYWMESFGDPTFEYHVAMTQIWGLLGLELATDYLPPFNYVDYAFRLGVYLSSVEAEIKAMGWQTDLSELKDAIRAFASAAAAVEQQVISGVETEDLKDRLSATERYLIDEDGLPGRPYYRHVVVAPGLNQGYAPQVLPYITDTILTDNEPAAQPMVSLTAAHISNAAAFLLGN